MAVVRNLLVRAGADFSSLRRELRGASSDLDKFKITVKTAMAGIAAAFLVGGLGAGVKEAVKDAMSVEAALQQVNRMMSTSSSEFRNWANENAIAFGISRSEAVRYGAVFSNLIGTFAKTSDEIMGQTTDILKASAVISGATGRDMEDVMFRIRSGLLGNTEAIEDLGVNVNVAMLESTEAFRKFAGDKSWLQLSFQTQQQIRLTGILEQTAKKYGTTVAKNTASDLGTFVAHLRNTKLALGQAFLPIINIALPALTMLAQALSNAMNIIAQFTAAFFGYKPNLNSQTGAITGLGNAYEETGDKAKKAASNLQGFDEINQLQEDKGSKGGTSPDLSAAGLGANALDDVNNALEAAATRAELAAKRLKEALKELFTDADKKRATDAVNELKASFINLKQALAGFSDNKQIGEIGKTFATLFKDAAVSKFTGDMTLLSGQIDIVAGALKGLDGILSGDFETAFEGAEDVVLGFYDTINGIAYMLLPVLGDSMKKTKEKFVEQWRLMKADIKAYGDPTKLEISDFGSFIRDVLAERMKETKEQTRSNWNEMKSIITEVWENIKVGISWGSMKEVIGNVWMAIKQSTSEEWESIKTTVSGIWDSFLTFIKWDSIKTMTANTWNAIKTNADESWTSIKKTVATRWDDFKTAISWNSMKTLVSNIWTSINTGAGTLWESIKQTVNAKWDEITRIDLSGITDAFRGIWRDMTLMTENTWNGIGRTIKDSINSVIDLVNSFITQINDIEIKVPKVKIGDFEIGGATIGMPKIPRIPRLAKGGITNGEMLAMIGDNPGGQEVVSPLSDLLGMITSVVNTAMSSRNTPQQQGDIVIQIGGVEVARAIQSYTKQENNRLGGSFIVTT